MSEETFRLVTAATHYVPAVLWGAVAYDLGHFLRTRRPPSTPPRLMLVLACCAMVHYATWTCAALLRGHLQQPSLLRGAMTATTDVSVIVLIAVARHIGVLWIRRGPISTAWLAVNYGLCAGMVVVAAASDLFLLPLPGLQTYVAYSFYLLVLGVLVVLDFRRGAAPGAWRPGALWQARSADAIVIGVALVLVAVQQTIPARLGSTPLALLLGPEHPEAALAMFALNGVAALVFATPFVIRNLGDLLPGFVTALAMTGAIMGVLAAGRATIADAADPTIVGFVEAAVVVAIVFVLMPLRTWLHTTIGRVVFRRGRLHLAELHHATQTLPPEAGAIECCRRTSAELVRIMGLRGAAVLLRDGSAVTAGTIDVSPLERAWPRDGAGIPPGALELLHFADLPPDVSAALTTADVLAVVPIASPRRHWGWAFLTTDLRGASFSEQDDAAIAAATDQLALTLDAADLLARAVAVERSLAHAEKLAAIGELAARFAHDIRNPVTAARSLAQQLARDPAAPANAEHAGIILEELERVERQVRDLLRFARREELSLTPVDLSALVRATARDFGERFAAGNIATALDTTDGVVARADPEKLRQVLVNLIENAMDALGNGRAERHVSLTVARDGRTAMIRVADDGPGIPEDAQARVFDPFVSLKPSGTGLGLAIAKRTIDAHGGTISVASRPGATTFEIRLPAETASSRER
jgi:signal transduction histidine kinase